MKYLQLSFYTLTGIKTFIDLGDFVYGEWIVYDDRTPKYHINVFSGSISDVMIKFLLDKKEETIESLIGKVNIKHGTKLSFGKRPLIELLKKEELINLTLTPLPEHWITNL